MATSDIPKTKSPRQHTPGPWHFQVWPSGDSGNIFNLAVTTAYHVGTFTSGSRRDIGTFLDNARLIATAPEMYDLLAEINHAFYVDGTSKALKAVMAKTKPLLSKARGHA